ncbi:MAG: response regulator [Smithella sp.]|jgi:TPR repeat protein/CheY-like chemotaxis protein
MSENIKNVLLVDDEELFLEFLAEKLSIFKDYFNVMTAPNGKEALPILKSAPINLVITDLSMPKMDGFELVAYLGRNYPQIPAIVMTCYSTPKIEEIFRNMGVFHFMEKPLDFPLVRLIPGRHYRPEPAAVFINELLSYIADSLGVVFDDKYLELTKEKILGGQLLRGTKVSPVIEYKELVSFKETAVGAKNGSVESQFYLGYDYYAGTIVPKNDRKAAKWISLAAAQGYMPAKLFLGHMYLRGDGLDKDKKRGVMLIIEISEQGYYWAQLYLARMYENGDEVEKDENEASRWFEQARKTKFMDEKNAAEQGNADAQYFVGNSFLTGNVVTKNYREALKWFEKAARQGHAHAKFELGRMYLRGEAVERDNKKGVKLIKEAAEQGDLIAQMDLSNRYRNGDGVEKDENEASKWFEMSWSKRIPSK